MELGEFVEMRAALRRDMDRFTREIMPRLPGPDFFPVVGERMNYVRMRPVTLAHLLHKLGYNTHLDPNDPDLWWGSYDTLIDRLKQDTGIEIKRAIGGFAIQVPDLLRLFVTLAGNRDTVALIMAWMMDPAINQ